MEGMERVERVERPETRVDRRARRTRTQLRQAFLEVLRQKRFESVTIQDITERADVSRTTFYAHFPDKYALLEFTFRAQFQQALAGRFPAAGGGWDAASMRLLIGSCYAFLMEVKELCKPFDTQMELLAGKLAQSELTTILTAWAGDARKARGPAPVRLKTIVSATSWIILGTGIEWAFQRTLDEETISAGDITEQVILILTQGVARLAPELVL